MASQFNSFVNKCNTTISELFEETVGKYGERTAVQYNDNSLNYNNLNKEVNKLAHFLRQKKIGPDQIVGIMAERSFELIIGIYGILKSGAGYLPLSTSDPIFRVQRIIDDAVPAIVIVQQKYVEEVAKVHQLVFTIEEILQMDLSVENPVIVNKPSDLAYVIYTSGSTGMPKGVMIEHCSVVNRMHWMQEAYPIDCNDVIIQKTPITFDVSVWELIWWGFRGASVFLPFTNHEKDPRALIKDIEKFKISVIHFVPSMFNLFLEYLNLSGDISLLSTLRLLFTSGEALKVSHGRRYYDQIGSIHKTKLVNLYGPTEATVDVTHYEYLHDDTRLDVPIGKPISNTRMYVLDNADCPTADTAGELCIAGVGLARGYLNQVELTTEKFTKLSAHPDERIYRTGDLAKWLPDGNLQYLGRIDQQVKIRGMRIELGEIESILNEYPQVESCLIDVKRPSENIVLLTAYYVAPDEVPATELKKHLGKYLPAYMIPNFFKQITVMPLTAHGKINRKALPELSLK